MDTQTSLFDALELFLLDVDARRLTKRTRYFYLTSITAFIRWCETEGAHTIADVSPAHLRRYQVELQERTIKGRPLSSNYQHNLIRVLRTFFAFLVAEGLLERSPFKNVRLPKLEKKVLLSLTTDEVRQVLAACRTRRDKALVTFLLDTGVRAAELCALNVGDVDMAAGTVHVRKGKGQKGRMVYTGARSRRTLKAYLVSRGHVRAQDPLFVSQRGGSRCTPNGLTLLMRRVQRKTGIKHCTCHALRRTFAITCLRNGMNVHMLGKLMGHADIGILRRYLDIVEADLQAAHESFGPVDHLEDS